MSTNKVAIIGAGLAGLTSALRLAHKGYQVSVFEKNPTAGGKAGLWEKDGFSFDTGPSLLTMKFVLDELFEDLGLKTEDYFQFIQLPILCKYFYEDGSSISAYADATEFAQEIQEKTVDSAKSIIKILEYAENIYTCSSDFFLLKEYKFSRLLSLSFLKSIWYWPKPDIPLTLATVVDRYLQDQRSRSIFYRYATYNGSSPFSSPSLYLSIAHVEHNLPAWILQGGIYEIPRVLENLAKTKGVQFFYNSSVEHINTLNSKASGLRIGGQNQDFDSVIYTGDFWNLPKILPEFKQFEPKTKDLSTSAILFYWGINEQHPQLDLHNIFFSGNYAEEFKQIRNSQVQTDPTIYVNITSKILPQTAPEGQENWFVMVNTPPDSGQDWPLIAQQIKAKVIAKVKRITGIDLSQKIILEKIVTPVDLAANTSAYRGSLYGLSTNSFLRTLRPTSKTKKFKNLYLAGGTVYPGGGMPLAILSGKFAADNFESLT